MSSVSISNSMRTKVVAEGESILRSPFKLQRGIRACMGVGNSPAQGPRLSAQMPTVDDSAKWHAPFFMATVRRLHRLDLSSVKQLPLPSTSILFCIKFYDWYRRRGIFAWQIFGKISDPGRLLLMKLFVRKFYRIPPMRRIVWTFGNVSILGIKKAPICLVSG